MSFADIEAKTTITGFSAADKATILAAMRTAYEGSTTARALFDNWISDGKTISISVGKPSAWPGMGQVWFDLKYLASAMYIDNNGTAVKDTVVTAIVHELVHALTVPGLLDDGIGAKSYKGDPTEYRGETVICANAAKTGQCHLSS